MGGVVRKEDAVIGGTGVPDEDAQDLVREILQHGGIGFHHVAIGVVGHEHELAEREGEEELPQEDVADVQLDRQAAEIQGPHVEGAGRVGGGDEIVVDARALFRRGAQVVEMHVGDGARPGGVDFRHVEPGLERAGEGVEEGFERLVDAGDAQDVVNVGYDGEARRGHHVRCGVADVRSLRVDGQPLDLVGRVPVLKPPVCDRDEVVIVAHVRGDVWKGDVLAFIRFRRPFDRRYGWDVEFHFDAELMDDEDVRRDIPRLISLVEGKFFHRSSKQEQVREVVQP